MLEREKLIRIIENKTDILQLGKIVVTNHKEESFTAGNAVPGICSSWPGLLFGEALPPQERACVSGEESQRNKLSERQRAEMLLDWSLKGIGLL